MHYGLREPRPCYRVYSDSSNVPSHRIPNQLSSAPGSTVTRPCHRRTTNASKLCGRASGSTSTLPHRPSRGMKPTFWRLRISTSWPRLEKPRLLGQREYHCRDGKILKEEIHELTTLFIPQHIDRRRFDQTIIKTRGLDKGASS